MADIFESIKNKYSQGGMLWRLLIVNVAVFVALRAVAVLVILFDGKVDFMLRWLGVPASILACFVRPWTFITYMFVHYDFMHIIFNMLWFYLFAGIFLRHFTPKHLFGLYIMGGLSGAALYLAAFNIFPYFDDKVTGSYLIGASASILAIVFATAVRDPEYKLNFFFFNISLKWVALITVVIDFLSIVESNAGGHVAHLGGALMGFAFTWFYNRGTDIAAPLNRLLDWCVTQFGRIGERLNGSRSFSATPPSDQVPRTPRANGTTMDRNAESELNEILEKIKRSGYAALTEEERKRLFKITSRD